MVYQKLDKNTAVKTWLSRGFHHFHLAFELNEGRWFTYVPYFDALGLEIFAKAYFIAQRSAEFEELNSQEAKKKIDSIARAYNHKFKILLGDLNAAVGGNKIQNLLGARFDSFEGDRICEVLMAANTEIRYPVPTSISNSFPIAGTNMTWDPLMSSGVSKFAYSVSREILASMKAQYGLGINKADVENFIIGAEESGVRFCRLFFNDEPDKFLIC